MAQFRGRLSDNSLMTDLEIVSGTPANVRLTCSNSLSIPSRPGRHKPTTFSLTRQPAYCMDLATRTDECNVYRNGGWRGGFEMTRSIALMEGIGFRPAHVTRVGFWISGT